MKTFVLDVTRRVVVNIDEGKMRPRMADFNACITDFGEDEDAFKEHAHYLAVLAACGIYDFRPDEFIEGYGPVAKAGLSVKIDDEAQYVELVTAEAGA